MENNNSVAFVGKITAINSIKDCDNICQIIINGWSSIVKKDVYKVGDLVGIATVDAILPDKMVEKLQIKNYLRKGNRVRIVKLRGIYSECLIFDIDPNYKEGQDLMSDFNIIKYEEPVKQIQLSSGRKVKYHSNPNFHTYYKFPNIKNVPDMFNLSDIVQVTRKIHGTNARYGVVKKKKLSIIDKIKKFFTGNKWIDYEFIYGSHHVEKGSESQGFYERDVWRDIGDKYDIQNKLWKFIKEYVDVELLGSGILIYGEIYGPGIQKNYDYDLKEIDSVFFDVTINGEYQHIDVVDDILSRLNLKCVEEIYQGIYYNEIYDYAREYIFNSKVPHEGVVIKCISGDRRKIAKIINPEYLIYSEKNEVTDFH